jgi:hypothetical protein
MFLLISTCVSRCSFDNPDLALLLRRVQRLPYLGERLVVRVRLGQIRYSLIRDTVPHRLRWMGGHVHDPLTRPELTHSLPQLHAIAARHDDIENDEIHSAVGLAQHLERLDRAIGLEQPIALLTEDAGGESTGNALVIDNENGRGAAGVCKVQVVPPVKTNRGSGGSQNLTRGGGATTDGSH